MGLALNFVLSVVGFLVLIKCADFFVDGASSLAKNLKVPTIVIGLTIVAFGTSAPELAISFSSHLSGNFDILFGNVIGSNIANILLILGLSVLIVPFSIENEVIKKQIPILLLITMGFSTLFLDTVFTSSDVNTLSRADGIVLILFFSVFVYYLITVLSNKETSGDVIEKPKYRMPKSVIYIAIGITGIIISSDLIVNNVASIAESIGISQKIISVTVISIGTSLPELVTTVVAAKKGENEMAIGNIVGSNIFNIGIVLGLPIAVLGEATTMAFSIVDITFLLLAAVLLWIFSATDRKIRRFEAVVFLFVYCGYIGYVILQ